MQEKHIVLAGACALGVLISRAVWQQQKELQSLKRQHQSLRKQHLQKAAQRDEHSAKADESGHAHGEDSEFVPHHITAAKEDMDGNGRRGGRYFLLPGSNGRATVMAAMLEDVEVRKSGRGHDVHLGKLQCDGESIDVGICATGMGCPSVDIVVTELIKLGASRFTRVGTAGSLQPHKVRVGDVVIASAAVRDEGTTRHYAPLEFPATASTFMVQCLQQAAAECDEEGNEVNGNGGNTGTLASRTYCGVVHTKDSLYAREFGEGALLPSHKQYMGILKRLGVLASEMEAAHLFTLAHAQAEKQAQQAHVQTSVMSVAARRNGSVTGVIECGAVLGIVGDDAPFADKDAQTKAVQRSIRLALHGIRVMHRQEKNRKSVRRLLSVDVLCDDSSAEESSFLASP